MKTIPNMLDLCLESRVHLLRYPAPKGLYLKRDDELSFGVSGSKVRKFASLIPALEKRGVQNAVLIGGANSNNIVAGVQYFIERGITPTLFLRKPADPARHLNESLIRYFVSPKKLVWVERQDWPHVEEKAHVFARGIPNSFVLPEGACCKEAIEGAETLAHDIVRNILESGVRFTDIVIDAGTGMQAIALLQGLYKLGQTSHVHIVGIALQEEGFVATAKKLSVPLQLPYAFYSPATAKYFGSTNTTIMRFMQTFAKEQGVLLDPVYSAKLVYTAFFLARNHVFQGNTLLIHSGGGFSALNQGVK